MKPKLFFLALPCRRFALAIMLACSAGATGTTVQKANNVLDLNLPGSWTGGMVTGAGNIAAWDATVPGANATTLGADLSWRGIAITNPAGAVSIGGANTLTLGGAGIDMSTATQNLTLQSNLALAGGGQSWNLATGRTLSLATGSFSRGAGATLHLSDTGLVSSSMTGFTSAALTNGILPWATVGSGASSSFGTFSGSDVIPYTGATLASMVGSAWGGIGSGGGGLVNHEITISGTPGPTGLERNLNSIRYTGTGLVQQGNNTNVLLRTNAILNSGSGILSLATGGGSLFGITPGSTNELHLAAANAGITINGYIANNGINPGRVIISGPNAVTLSGANTYTGGTYVNSGRLIAGATSMNGGPIHLSSEGTLTFTGVNQTSTSTLTGSGAILNDSANTTIITGDHSGFSGTFTHSAPANNTQFNSATAGSPNAAYHLAAGELIFAAAGDYTVQFGALSREAGTIRGGNSATGTTTLSVGNLNTDSTISGNLNNGATKILALTKVGTGTLTLGGTNTYSGLTTINSGTLRVNGSIAATTSIINNANLVFEPIPSITVPNPITGNGTLELAGGGTLVLSGNNNVAGPTLLNQGELQLKGTFGSISILDDVTNRIGAAPASTFTAGSLNFGGEATVSLPITGTPGGTALFAISGAISTTPANGKVVLDVVAPVISNGLHRLIEFGSLPASLADFQLLANGLNSRQSATLVLDGAALAMQVNGDSPKWTGLDGGNWVAGSTGPLSNWKLVTAGSTTNYQEGDDVLFDDSATGSTTINIASADVSPRITNFSNNTKHYTLTSASFGIVTGGMAKSGAGSLTLECDNIFTEGFQFAGGTLNLNSIRAIGTGAFQFIPGTPKTINNTSGMAIVNAFANPQSWLDDFTFTGSSDLDLGIGEVTLGGDDAARVATITAGTLAVGELKSPSHGLVKAGAGTLVLTSTGAGAAASVLSGTLDVAAGTLQINRSAATAEGSGDLTATGITGSGTISNGADVYRILFINTAGEQTFTGTLANGGTGALGFSKQGSGTVTLSSSNTYSGDTLVGAANGAGILRATANQALGTGTIVFDTSGGNPGPTSRLETSGDITLPNAISLHQRNNPTPNLLHTGGNTTLSGNINLNVGGGRGNIESDAGLLTLAGTISAATVNPRNLHLGGAGEGLVTGAIMDNPVNPTGFITVHKNGVGTWTLAGMNTYTGETIVNAGTLAVSNPVLADTAAVRLFDAGTLHLSHSATDTIDRLFIDGAEQLIGTWGGLASSATHKTARITGTGILNVVNGIAPPSGFGTWAAATGLTAGVNDASTLDANADGFDNGTEYLLGGLPLDATNNPKIHSFAADSDGDVDGDKELILTIAVPVGTPAFSAGAPTSTATFEGYTLTVRGSADLATFPTVVTPVNPIVTGLPPAPVQGGITYEYRSFSLNGSNGLTTQGFLQVLVTHP